MDELVQVKKVLAAPLFRISTTAHQTIFRVQLIWPLLLISYHNSVFLDSDQKPKPHFYNTAWLC